jgi:hypothetical protein
VQAFASAEALFKRASDLFADLDEPDNASKAYSRMEESFERKIHAEEIKASYVVRTSYQLRASTVRSSYVLQPRPPPSHTTGYTCY